jgi:hypothetical protein
MEVAKKTRDANGFFFATVSSSSESDSDVPSEKAVTAVEQDSSVSHHS